VHILRQEWLSKPSNSTSGPAWPGSKPEPGLHKIMQSSTEAQIRFLLKKCHIIASVAGEGGSLAASVGTGMSSRGLREVVGSLQGPGAGGALFALHVSRVVVLLEQSANQCGEALDAVTVVLEKVLEGSKGSADTFTDLVGTSVGGEDLLAIKDFLWRHTEILRGRGGISSSSACNSAGVGMVAAAVTLAALVVLEEGMEQKSPCTTPLSSLLSLGGSQHVRSWWMVCQQPGKALLRMKGWIWI
jgi:protein SMG8